MLTNNVFAGMECYGQILGLEVTCSATPVQIEGRLRGGERFYFRSRSGKTSLRIFENDFRSSIVSYSFNHEVKAGCIGDLPDEECVYLLNEWIKHYLFRATKVVFDSSNPAFVLPARPGMAFADAAQRRLASGFVGGGGGGEAGMALAPKPAPTHAPSILKRNPF